jgi:galactokinase
VTKRRFRLAHAFIIVLRRGAHHTTHLRIVLTRVCSEPDFFVRAPGRVNLIGEHVDYSGYPVMPMAIERDTIIAIKVEKDSNALKLVRN